MADDTYNIDTREEADPTDDKRDKEVDEIELLRRVKGWFKSDAAHRAKWEKQASEDFGFVACDQWSKDDQDFIKDSGRVPVVFNRVLTVIKSIAGSEINGRLDTRFLPRGVEDSKANELLSAASDWMADECDAEDEQSEAFESVLICGEGWTEAMIEFDEDPEGRYVEVEVDPREMYPDCKSRKKNYADARRLHRARVISLQEARSMFPDVKNDDDFDASWASTTAPGDSKDPKPVEDKLHQDDMEDPVVAEKTDVTIVHTQWYEKEPYWLVAMESDQLNPDGTPAVPQQPEELSNDEYKAFAARSKKMGIRHKAAKMQRKVFKQAFTGRKVLHTGPTLCPYEFSFNAITGERDRKNNSFYGLVKVMRDPQMWANKMLSNALHIANTTAKGGIIAETGAFVNQRQAEESYAQPNEITWAEEGAVSGEKIMPKPGGGDPSVYIKLLEFAITSVRDVTGVNMELLGLRDVNQPGVLEAQRKQAAMTVLASIFNSLRRFRKGVGRIRLHIIQEHFSDGRLIRIKGQDGAQSIPLIRDKTAGEYDVVIADAPTSPNQKEATWALIQQILPVFKDMLTPEVTLALLEYSPFPTDVVEKLRTINQQAAQNPDNQKKGQLSLQLLEGQVAALMAKASKDNADAQTKGIDAQTRQQQAQLGFTKEAADARAADAKAQAIDRDSKVKAARTMSEAAMHHTHSQIEQETARQDHVQSAEQHTLDMAKGVQELHQAHDEHQVQRATQHQQLRHGEADHEMQQGVAHQQARHADESHRTEQHASHQQMRHADQSAQLEGAKGAQEVQQGAQSHQADMQQMMAEFAQKMAALFDQKIQTALAVQGQAADQSLAQKSLEGNTEIQKLKIKAQGAQPQGGK